MFSQRKKKYRNMVWASVLTAVALLSLVLLLGYLGSFRDKSYEEAPANETVSVPKETQVADADTVESKNTETKPEKDDNEPFEKNIKKQTYYLIKYDNDVIRVYFSDQQGNMTELEETNIIYETLSSEDQMQFQTGIQVENRDALNRLLMDYES